LVFVTEKHHVESALVTEFLAIMHPNFMIEGVNAYQTIDLI